MTGEIREKTGKPKAILELTPEERLQWGALGACLMHEPQLRAIVRHVLGFANGLPGARNFRRILSGPTALRDASPELLWQAWREIRLPEADQNPISGDTTPSP